MTVEVALPDTMADARVEEWMSSGMHEGWRDTIDRLIIALNGATQIVASNRLKDDGE
jgi:hypothetical protein